MTAKIMNCGEFQSRLQAWLNGDADEGSARALEAHLAHCPQCEQQLESANDLARQEDQLCCDAFAEPRAAARVAERAIARLVLPPAISRLDVASPPRTTSWSTWLVPLISLAAGFLLAMLVLPGEQETPQPGVPPAVATGPEAPVQATPVAHLVAATGPVEIYDDQQQSWSAIDPIRYFACPTNSRVRTATDVRCELKTGDGCVIRMNDQTEVTLRGGSNIELSQGQLWCRSPKEAVLEVRITTPTGSDEAKQPAAEQPKLWSVGASCMVTRVEKAGHVQVVNAEGEINLQTAAGQQTLEPGQVAEIANGAVTRPAQYVDPVLSTRWMHPLLVRGGVESRELQERVDAMLAQIGRTKIATLYEQEIRTLGDHAVLPLVRFIQSPLAAEDPPRRHAAMRLTADLAPVWLIPDLIDLLGNSDPYVRQQAAATLHRLTALDMSLPANAWKEEPGEQHAAAIRDWRNWWATHGDQYPTPRVQITRE